jgi:hypothetical protein
MRQGRVRRPRLEVQHGLINTRTVAVDAVVFRRCCCAAFAGLVQDGGSDVPRPSFWRKALRATVFSTDLREPGISAKLAYENTMPAAPSSGCTEHAKRIGKPAAWAVCIRPLARKTARFCPNTLNSRGSLFFEVP